MQDQGPTTIRTFSLDDQGHLWHTVRANPYQDDKFIFEARGHLDWPLWTPRGVLVTQYNDQKSRFLLIENGHKTVRSLERRRRMGPRYLLDPVTSTSRIKSMPPCANNSLSESSGEVAKKAT